MSGEKEEEQISSKQKIEKHQRIGKKKENRGVTSGIRNGTDGEEFAGI